MHAPLPEPMTELHQLAVQKAAAVLGAERARRLIERLMRQLGIGLDTPSELLLLSEAMSQLGGFEGAVGAMLGVAAIMRGAAPIPRDPPVLSRPSS